MRLKNKGEEKEIYWIGGIKNYFSEIIFNAGNNILTEIIIWFWLESGGEMYKIVLKLLGGAFFFFPHFKNI